MQSFCTIVSHHHLPYAKAVLASLRNYDSKLSLQVLVTDADNSEVRQTDGLRIWTVQEISNSEAFQKLYKRQGHRRESDEFRWALKPVFLCHLLKHDFEKMIYVDADVFFFSSPLFLFEQLETSSILLTPHWRSIDPLHFDDLFALLKDGYFNGGFIGANRHGVKALEWWAEACTAKMEKSLTLGLYDDQKYLDLLPHEFAGVQVVQHRGCNLAYWNMDTNRRQLQDGKLLINGKFEPVFVHFTNATVRHIDNGNDALLRPMLDAYRLALKVQGLSAAISIQNDYRANPFLALKRRLLLRTRLKRFLHRLSEKL